MVSSRQRPLAPLRSDLPPQGEWHPYNEWPPPLRSDRISEASGAAAGDAGIGAADPRSLLLAGRIGSASVPLPPCGISPRKSLVAPALRGPRLAAKSTSVQCALEPHWATSWSPRAASSAVSNIPKDSTDAANMAESQVSSADVTGLPSFGQQAAVDLADSKNAEVVHYHWHVVRNQLSAVKGEVAEVRAALDALRSDGGLAMKVEDLARELRDSQKSSKAVETKVMENLDFFVDKVNSRHASLDKQVRQALQESEDMLQRELTQVKEDQAKLRERCALKETVETAEASLRRQMTASSREEKARYTEHCKHVEICIGELDRKINAECRRMMEELSLHKEEMRNQLEGNVEHTEKTRKREMGELSFEHHTRHDDIHKALTTSNEDLKEKISDTVGRAFDAQHRDFSELRSRFDDALEELDVKVAEVRALYCEASEKRREAYALSWKFTGGK